jgi:hypothetical protein
MLADEDFKTPSACRARKINNGTMAGSSPH